MPRDGEIPNACPLPPVPTPPGGFVLHRRDRADALGQMLRRLYATAVEAPVREGADEVDESTVGATVMAALLAGAGDRARLVEVLGAGAALAEAAEALVRTIEGGGAEVGEQARERAHELERLTRAWHVWGAAGPSASRGR